MNKKGELLNVIARAPFTVYYEGLANAVSHPLAPRDDDGTARREDPRTA